MVDTDDVRRYAMVDDIEDIVVDERMVDEGCGDGVAEAEGKQTCLMLYAYR